jgi:hypothetical protein
MRSLAVIGGVAAATVAAVAVPVLATVHRGPIPNSVHRVTLRSHSEGPQPAARYGVIRGRAARELVRDADRLRPYPPGTVFPCPTPAPSAPGQPTRARIRNSRYHANGHVWVVSIGWCGRNVTIAEDGDGLGSFHPSRDYSTDLRRDFATLSSWREQVPASLRKARLTYRKEPTGPVTRRRTVTGRRAKELVIAFDQLKREPKNYITCDVAGGPTERVRFHTAAHTWIATQSACSELQVTRDGKSLPTLLPSRRWERLVRHDLGG